MMKKVLFVILSVCALSAFSQTKEIQALEKKRKAALKEIEMTNKLLVETKKTTINILKRIELLTSQISARNSVVSILNKEVNALEMEQRQVQAEIVDLEAELKSKQASYAKAVRSMAVKRQSENKLLFVLSGKSIGESIRRMRYMKDYSEWRNKEADDIKLKKDRLDERKDRLEKSRFEKLSLMALKESEQKKLAEEEDMKQSEMVEASKKEKDLQKILSEKQRQAQALNQQIERLIAQEIEKQRKKAEEEARKLKEKQEREAVAAAKKQGQSKPKTKPEKTTPPTEQRPALTASPSTAENMKLSNNFASNRGRLPMPISGSYAIVGRFGTQQQSRYITTNSNGIDLEGSPGAEAKAVFSGEVSRVIAFPGYNNCVIVRHGDYYTFYGNIQNVYVRVGDKVSTGQAIGSAYNDPESGRSQIHFQLWKGTTKMNPEPWLKK